MLERVVEQHGFKGLKLHPSFLAFAANDKDWVYPIVDKARQLKICVMESVGGPKPLSRRPSLPTFPPLAPAARQNPAPGRRPTRPAGDALQLHGGYGYVMESPIQRLYRDVKLFEIGEGTSQIHRNIIARQLGLA